MILVINKYQITNTSVYIDFINFVQSIDIAEQSILVMKDVNRNENITCQIRCHR